MNDIFHRSLPQFIAIIFNYGYLGVPIFFVLSGFVIAHAIKREKISLQYVGAFIVRRAIRLDVPYWAAIILAVTMLLVKKSLFNIPVDMPSCLDVFAHMFYLQDFLQIDPVLSTVFWTLCLEIQFYIFFIFSIYIIGKFSSNYTQIVHAIFLLVTGLISLLIYLNIFNIGIHGIFFPYWHFFVSGVIIQKVLAKSRIYQICVGGWLLLIFIGICIHKSKSYLITEGIMILFIYTMGITGKLKSWLNFAPLQFLGAISYSLYLTHSEIGWKIISILQSVTREHQSMTVQVVIFIAGLGGSVFFAYAFYWVIERASLQLARKVVLPK